MRISTLMEQDSLLNVSGRNSQLSASAVFAHSKLSSKWICENFYFEEGRCASQFVGLKFSEVRFIGIVCNTLSRERTFENFYSEGGIYASQYVW